MINVCRIQSVIFKTAEPPEAAMFSAFRFHNPQTTPSAVVGLGGEAFCEKSV